MENKYYTPDIEEKLEQIIENQLDFEYFEGNVYGESAYKRAEVLKGLKLAFELGQKLNKNIK